MSKQRRFQDVAVLLGGPSAEREVSLASGGAVARGLREAGYRVTEVDPPGPGFELPASVEAVFIALHGEYGEDGQVQAELRERGVPYTGSGPEASRDAMDKVTSKRIFEREAIPTASYEVLQRGDTCRLPPPLVVKPARQGSSIGVHLVREPDGLEAALEDAFRYDEALLAEAYVPGRELTVGMLDGEALPVIEIRAPDTWYDYGAKYTQGACEYLVPAPIGEAMAVRCRDIAARTFSALGCRGFGRVDMRAASDEEIFVLELNSVPGFTETSLLPKAAAEAGIPFPELCDRIMQMAEV